MYAKKNSGKKAVLLLLVVVLLIGCTIGGTVAYLMTKTSTVTNTFVAGNIGNLALTENTGESYIVVPGKEIEKDPVITFSGNNVPAYVFLEIDATGWTVTGSDTTYTYTIGTGEKEMKWTLEGWKAVPNNPGVYYQEVDANTNLNASIISGNKISVGSAITKDDLGANSAYLKNLTFTAYAIQKDTFADAAAAWAVAKDAT